MKKTIFDDLNSKDIDLIISDPVGLENQQVRTEDSPVAIDTMISVQNGKLMFVSSIKIGTLVGLLETEDPRLSVEQRRQRKPDLGRIPKMAEYLHGKPWAYSAITVALSGPFQFSPINRPDGTTSRLGTLRIPRGFKTRNIIIDGQHRFLSFRAALGLEPSFSRYALPYEQQQLLAEENIAVIFYAFKNDNDGVEWSQQYFHDLNCLGISASRSLGIKFDKRSPINQLSVLLSERAIPFVGRIEMEERQCGVANPNLFTLSAVKNANKYLLDEVSQITLTQSYDQALLYWNSIGAQFPEWTTMQGNEVRDKYIHGFGVILSAFGLLGKHLFNNYGDNYSHFLPRLKSIDWSKWKKLPDDTILTNNDGQRCGNPFWNGFAMAGSTVQNTSSNIRHTEILIRKHIGLELSQDEQTLYQSVRPNGIE